MGVSFIMNKVSLIQEIIDRKKAKIYLEIGVSSGITFFKIRVKRKMAVDPIFKISKKRKIKSILENILNIFNKYFQMTSDDFFRTKSSQLKCGLEVVLVDGLHTFKQALKDIQNCLKFLKEDGIIIVHDCNPTFEAIAYPAQSLEHASSLNLADWTGEWCGDVWKAIVYLRSTRSDLNVFVLDIDYGLGIITKGKPENILKYSKEEIDRFSYNDLRKNRRKMLNLKSNDYFKEFIKKIEI